MLFSRVGARRIGSMVFSHMPRRHSTLFSPLPRRWVSEASLLAKRRLERMDLMPEDLGTMAFQQRLESARVFYDAEAFADNLKGDQAFSLERAITKVAAVDVEASRYGEMIDGSPWKGATAWMEMQPGDPEGLSPEERVNARKKVIASRVNINRYGGYPSGFRTVSLRNPVSAVMLSIAGPQFEDPRLDYRQYMVDAVNQPERYQELQALLKTDSKLIYNYIWLKGGLFSYIQRSPATGQFSTGFCASSAVILDREAYLNAWIENFALLFSSALKMSDSDKKIYFKLPLIGMGFFAKIDGVYDIKNVLVSIFVDALKKTLERYGFDRISMIEIPVFDEEVMQVIELVYGDDNERILFSYHADLLDTSHVNLEKFDLCIANPADANALPGNELGTSKNYPTSVESAIGNNTDIRFIQNHLLNPHLTKPENWIGVRIGKDSYDYEESPLLSAEPVATSPSP